MWLHRSTRRRTPFGRRFRGRFRRPVMEQLERRLLLANGSFEITLDPIFDMFGFQPETTQFYENQGSLGSIFDTGASVVTFSAVDQLLMDPFGGGSGIPIKVPGGAEAEGIGGMLTGDVSEPGTVLVDGIHVNVFSGNIFESGSYFDQLQGRGSVASASSGSQFIGDDRLNLEDDVYSGFSLVFTSTSPASSANLGAGRTITDYDGDTRTFTFSSGFPAVPTGGDTFHVVVGQGVAAGPIRARERLSGNGAGLGLSGSGDAYVGRYLLFTSGELAGDSQLITGYDGATHTFKLALPFSQRPQAGDTFDVLVGTGSSAVMPGVQVFVGTFEGSGLLSTISGTPMLNATSPLPAGGLIPNPAAGPQPLHPNGLALEVGPQEMLLDLGELLGDFDEFLGDLFEGITLPIPSVQFREPGTRLDRTESFYAETAVVDTPAPTAGQFVGGSELPGDPEFEDFFIGFHVRFLTGGLEGEIQQVSDYDAATRTLTFDTPFSAAPGAGDVFELVRVSSDPVTLGLDFIDFDNHLDPGDIMTVSPNPVSNDVRLAQTQASGEVVGGTAGEFAGDSSLSDVDDAYNGMTVVLTSGPLAGEEAVVADYLGATRTFQFETAFSAAPDPATTFDVVESVENQIFLFDTGAQLSTISVDEALALGFNLSTPEFKVNVQGAGGVVSGLPGYLLDELSIPTLEGGALTFRNVPVFVLDVAEELQGLLGMNLFNSGAEFLYDPFDPNYGQPTLQTTFFNQRSEVAPEDIDISQLEPLQAALLQAVAEVMPGAFGGFVGLREISLPGFGVGVDLDLTAQNGIVREENGVTVVTVTPGTSIDFTAEVPFTAEFYDSFQLDFVGSDTALWLHDWNTDAVWTTTSDGTLSFPGDSSVSAAGDAALSAILGSFVVQAPPAPGDYLLTAGDGAGNTSFTLSGMAEPLPVRDFGDVIIRVQEAPSLAIRDATLVEGAGGAFTDLELTVTRTGDPGIPIAVDYATADDGSAQAGSDYTATSGTLVFAPGETEKTFTVRVDDDSDPEDGETFLVNLSNARYAPFELTPVSDGTAIDVDGDPLDLLLGEPFEDMESAAADVLKVEGALPGTSAKAFALEFDVSSIPATAVVGSATLAFVEQEDDLTTAIDVHGYEGTGTVELAYPFNTGFSNPMGQVGNGSQIIDTADLRDFVQDLIDNDKDYAGFYVEGASASDRYFVYSRERATPAERPKLTIQYTVGTGTVDVADAQAVVTIRNDDTEISISDRERTEGDAGQSEAVFVVQLSKPSALEVSVHYATSDGTASAGDYEQVSGTAVFAPGETSKAVSVPVLGDMRDEPDETFSVELSSPTNATLTTTAATGTILDNDTAGVQILETGGDTQLVEGGATDTYTIVLTSQPTHDVHVLLDPDTQVGVDPAGPLVFTPANWHEAQTVTVSAVDDDVVEGAHTGTILHTAASTDPRYNGIAVQSVTAAIVDNDTAGITVTPASGLTTAEAAGIATFTVVLDSEPTADVTIGIGSSDTSEGTVSPTSLTFTAGNWQVAQWVTVQGVNDDVDDGDVAYTIVTAAATSGDAKYAGRNAADVSVTNSDDDTAGIRVGPTSGLTTTEPGGTAVFVVQLESEPTSHVTIGLSSSDTSEGTVSPASLTFTPGNWRVAQWVTVTGVDDDVDDGDVAYTIVTAAAVSADGKYNGLNADDVSATNTDDDTAGITVIPTSGLTTTEAGGTATFTVWLESEPEAPVTIGVSSDDPSEGTVSPTTLTFLPEDWGMPQTVTVTGVDDVIDDADAGYTIVTAAATSADANYDALNAEDVSVTNADDDTAGVQVLKPSGGPEVVEGGATDTYHVVLSSRPTHAVEIAVVPDEQLGVAPSLLTFTPDDWDEAQSVTVSAVDDAAAEGLHTGTITHTASSADPAYNGTAVAGVTAQIGDNDSPPSIGSLADDPDPVERGNDLTLTANAVTDPEGDVAGVTFWRDANGNQGLDGSDEELGTDTDPTGGWSAVVSTASFPLGEATYFAQAIDGGGRTSNVVSASGRVESTVDLFGTGGPDTITFATGISHVVTINENEHTYDPAQVSVINVHAGDGHDSITITGGAEDETAELRVGSVDVVGTTYGVHAESVEQILVRAGQSTGDEAYLYDADATKDTFVATPAYGRIYGDGFDNRVEGFRQVTAASAGAGLLGTLALDADVAELRDSAGADLLEATPESAKLKFEGLEDHFVQAVGFRYVHAFASDDGQTDTAIFEDLAGSKDRFRAWPTEAKMYGLGFYNRAKGFNEVQASGSDWTDVAQLYDSPGADAFDAYADRATMSRSDGTIVRADDFRSLFAYASDDGQTDTAHLYDTTADLGTSYATWFKGFDGVAKMYEGATFYNRVNGFDEVIASAVGGDDTAKLFDSPGADALVAYADRGTMTYADGTLVQADDFRWVLGYASDDGQADTAQFYDTTADLGISYAIWFKAENTISRMYSGLVFYVQAGGFDGVTASAVGSDDTVKLFDSALDDAYWSRPDHSRMEYGNGAFAEALNFRYMYGYSRYGSDTATLYDETAGGTSYAARFAGYATWAKLYHGAFYSRTEGFAELRAAFTGGDDRVWLYDDPARVDHLVVPFPGDVDHAAAKAKFWNDHRAIYLDDFHTLTATTSEDFEDDKQIDPAYEDDVILSGDWADA
ncbi:MAG TPA: Calx-beta domain-containing protein [Thermoguttaceae bacterium]|nr:Calx-beta domain-containing protein [Thermoguttaceae bacterium]